MADLKSFENWQEGDPLAVSKEEAQILLDQMSTDIRHPLLNESAAPYTRARAVALQQRLLEIVAGTETSLVGHVEKHVKENREQTKALHGLSTGSGDVDSRNSSNGVKPSQSDSENGGMPVSVGIDVNRGSFKIPVTT